MSNVALKQHLKMLLLKQHCRYQKQHFQKQNVAQGIMNVELKQQISHKTSNVALMLL